MSSLANLSERKNQRMTMGPATVLYLSALLCFLPLADAQETVDVTQLTDKTCGIKWAPSLKEGMARAKRENKPLVVAISARLFADPRAKEF